MVVEAAASQLSQSVCGDAPCPVEFGTQSSIDCFAPMMIKTYISREPELIVSHFLYRGDASLNDKSNAMKGKQDPLGEEVGQ
jgi:hypothetical protein